MSECSATTAELWLADAWLLGSAVLYEQLLDQANDYLMTMLTVEGALDDEDDPDEEEEFAERWTTRSRR